MADYTLVLNGADVNPYVPPAGLGYTTGSDNGRILTGAWYSVSVPTAAIIYQTAPPTVGRASVVLGSVGSSSQGPCWLDANGDGYLLLVRSSDIRVFRVTASNTGLTLLAGGTYTGTMEVNDVIELTANKSTGEMQIRQNGTLRLTVTDTTHIAKALRLGFFSRGGFIKSFTVYDVSAITGINGGSSIVNGQAAVPFTSDGFGSITAITTNRTGVTCSNIVNSGGGAGTFDLSEMVDGAAYPILPTTVTYTFSDGTNTGTITEDLELEAGWEQVSYVAAYPLNDRMFCWHLDQAGISIADGTIVIWETVEGFAFTANGDSISDAERTVIAKVRDESTGLMSIWTVTIDEAGDVIDTTPDSFTFTAVTNATLNTTYTSNEVTIAGLGTDVEADLTIIDGFYSKNGGVYVSTAGVISNGDTLRVRRNSSGSYATAVDLDVTVGTYTTQFTITTEADTTPDTIKFTTLSALSDIKTITGLAGSTPITIVGGTYSKNGGGFTASAGTVVNTDTIQLSSEDGVTVRVTIGGKTFSWNSKGGGGGFGGSIGIGI